ncbi:MAG: hypothetical protein IJD49_05985 [Clostridia bacterium]|nr:hypothetical protein [Clostridia bacterium]
MKFRKTVKKILKSIAALAVVIVLLVVYFKTNTTVSSDFTIASATENSFFLTAHRGLSSVAPENSAPALEEAGKAGYYAAEFDIIPAKDGVWVLIHDDTVDRTMSGTGEVSSFTYDELLEMNIDEGKGIENYPELKISTLEEALDICKKYSMRPMIEIKGGKPEDMQSVLDIIKASGIENPLIIDFDSDRLSALRKLDPDIELWYLVNEIEDGTLEFANKNSMGIGFNFGIPQNYFKIKDAQTQGITLASWTVDMLPVLDLLCALGVDYITTNRILP